VEQILEEDMIAQLRYLALIGLATLTVMLAALSGPTLKIAHAAQHENANIYAFWNFGDASGFWNIDQRVQITQKAPSSYWAMLWGFTSTPNEGGYMGLQTDGSRLDGSQGDTAILSLWNANAASGSNCGTFSGEGSGYSCRLAYAIYPQTDYRFRIWRLNADAEGQWWAAWIQRMQTGVDTYIGSIRVTANKTLMTPSANFSEYYGNQVPCNAVPQSIAYFTQPAADQLSPGYYEYGSIFDHYSRASCTGGNTVLVDLGWTKAAEVTLGGDG
jgi:Domain of unknown function (DUF3472)